MKIGILTYHRTHNYGGCLQALATRLFLENMGHEVYYVDYWPDYHKRAYEVFDKSAFKRNNWKGKINYLLSVIKAYPYTKQRQKLFEKYHDVYTEPYCRPTYEQYDVIIYGSDQIWRKQSALNDYNPVYFGDNDFKAKKHISYAASMGVLPDKKKDDDKIATLLKNLDAISVRENSLKDYLEKLGFSNIQQTIDPTLLLDSKTWDKVIPSEPYQGNKYILIYTLWGEVFDMKSIRALAEKENLTIKVLRGKAIKKDTENEISLADPIDFLRLIKNAEYVFSSSFHGLVFSIIYQKQVFASFKTNGGRALSLLEALGIPNRYLDNYQSLSFPLARIEYNEVEQKLNALRKSSVDFLESIKS